MNGYELVRLQPEQVKKAGDSMTGNLVMENNRKVVGDLTGNADTATKATQDSAGQQINSTYIKNLSVSGTTITYTKGDNTTGTIVTQDTNTTYSTGTASAAGLTKLYTSIGSNTDGTMTQSAITTELNGKSSTNHTHNYAGSSSVGGAATTALACTGNSATATKLQTARTITIAGVTKTFDGTQNLTWDNISSGVSGDYLPLSGGTMTGALNGTTATMSGKVTAQSLDLGNKDTDTYYPTFYKRNGNGVKVGASYESVTGQNEPAMSIEVGKLNANGDAYDTTDIRYVFGQTVVHPNKDNAVDFGHLTRRWRNLYTNGLTATTLRLTSTSDASETSTNHALQIGDTTSSNLRIDDNELISLDNGVLSPFYINALHSNIETTDIETRPSFRITTRNKHDSSMRFYSTIDNTHAYWTIGKDIGNTTNNSFYFLYSNQDPNSQLGEKKIEFTKDGHIRLLKNTSGFQGVSTTGTTIQLAHVGADNISKFGWTSYNTNMIASQFMGGSHASLMANGEVTDTSGKVTLCCNGATYSTADNKVIEFYKDSGNTYVFRQRGNNHADSVMLGTGNYRWNTLYAMSPVNVTSDRNLKENIEYIQEQNLNPKAITTSDLSISDMYDFVKCSLNLAKYNYKSKKDEVEIGFVAQDVIYNQDGTDNKVGQFLVDPIKAKEDDTYLSYSMGTYTNIIAGALKQAINKIEDLEKRIEILENNVS